MVRTFSFNITRCNCVGPLGIFESIEGMIQAFNHYQQKPVSGASQLLKYPVPTFLLIAFGSIYIQAGQLGSRFGRLSCIPVAALFNEADK